MDPLNIIFEETIFNDELDTKVKEIQKSAFNGNTKRAEEQLNNLSNDEKRKIQQNDPTFLSMMDQVVHTSTPHH